MADNIEIDVVIPPVAVDVDMNGRNPTVIRTGTTDYNDLTNKPQINEVTLSGNKSFDDLGLRAITNLELDELVRRIFNA